MKLLDLFYKKIMNFFISEEFNEQMRRIEMEEIQCYVDENKVQQEVCTPTVFTDRLETKGYTYDVDKEWWVRTWTTNEGKESIIEAYKQQYPTGKWKQLMIGYGDRCFYEEDVVELEDQTH